MKKRTLPWKNLKWLLVNDYSHGLRETRNCIAEVCKRLHILEKDLSFLELVVDEAISNALEAVLARNLQLNGLSTGKVRLIDYFNVQLPFPEPTCKVSFWIKGDLLRIEVLDSGSGFVPVKKEIDLWSERGRGCLIMKSYMDHVIWRKRPAGGIRCIMIKQLKISTECKRTG